MSLRPTTQHLGPHEAPGRENGMYTNPPVTTRAAYPSHMKGTQNGHSSDCFFCLDTKKDATTMRYDMVVPSLPASASQTRGVLRRT